MLRRLSILLYLMVGLLFMGGPVYAGDGTNSLSLALDSWPVILAAGCGFLSTHLTALFTHYTAPQWVKSGINLALTALAGVLITVTVVDGKTWKDYLGEIAAAWITSLVVHTAGITAWIQNTTASVGIGKQASPLVPPPQATNDANTATGTF